MNTGRLIILFLLSIVILVSSCAKLNPPPGGPIDKTGPKILQSSPADMSTRISSGQPIVLQFSESIDKKTMENSVFISPRPRGEVKYKWKGESLEILFPEEYRDNTTYIVNIGSNVQDLRRNKMDSSFSFAFSTGDKIAPGYLEGTVFKAAKPFPGATVALYDPAVLDSLSMIDSVYAPFFSQSGNDGQFRMKYLPDGEYLVLAFEDKNNNQLLNVPREAYSLPHQLISIKDGKPDDDLNLFLQSKDTSSLSIINIGMTEDNLLKVRFSKAINIRPFKSNPENINLIVKEGQEFPASSIREVADEPTKMMHLYFEKLPTDSAYMSFNFKPTEDSNAVGDKIKSPVFFVEAIEDKKEPTINAFSHDRKTIFASDSELLIDFSEPCRIENLGLHDTLSPMLISSGDSSYINYGYKWTTPFQLMVMPEQMTPGESYRLTINESAVEDYHGNRIGDSLRSFSYAIHDTDSLGSITGFVNFDTTAGQPYLKVTDIKGEEFIVWRVVSNIFEFHLPAGKYTFNGYVDKNDNGQVDNGDLNPFTYSEKSYIFPDTIRVRARFETSGIELFFD